MSSEKAARTSAKKQIRNKSVRSATRTYVAAAFKSIADSDQPQSAAAVKQAIRALDKAAKSGIVHSNNAARRKSRLMKRFHSLASEG